MKKTLIALFMLYATAAAAQQPASEAQAERMLGFLLANQTDSLYANISDQVKSVVTREQLEGLLTKIEAQAGKYQKHGPWEKKEMMGAEVYVSMTQFENTELAALVVFDATGKMLGIQLVPAEAVKK